jgi:hypothetical protein
VHQRDALRPQVIDEQLGQPRVVVDQQDPHDTSLRQR